MESLDLDVHVTVEYELDGDYLTVYFRGKKKTARLLATQDESRAVQRTANSLLMDIIGDALPTRS